MKLFCSHCFKSSAYAGLVKPDLCPHCKNPTSIKTPAPYVAEAKAPAPKTFKPKRKVGIQGSDDEDDYDDEDCDINFNPNAFDGFIKATIDKPRGESLESVMSQPPSVFKPMERGGRTYTMEDYRREASSSKRSIEIDE